jgi:hypothetical protein
MDVESVSIRSFTNRWGGNDYNFTLDMRKHGEKTKVFRII